MITPGFVSLFWGTHIASLVVLDNCKMIYEAFAHPDYLQTFVYENIPNGISETSWSIYSEEYIAFLLPNDIKYVLLLPSLRTGSREFGGLMKTSLESILSSSLENRYKLLSRLESDCKYYLGYGGRNPRNLWALDERENIALMKAIHESFYPEEKPEWLITSEQISQYEKEMVLTT